MPSPGTHAAPSPVVPAQATEPAAPKPPPAPAAPTSEPAAPKPPPAPAAPASRTWPPAFADQATPMTTGPAPAPPPPPAAVPRAAAAPRMVPQPTGTIAGECTPCPPRPCECPSCPPQGVEAPEQIITSVEGTPARRSRLANIKSLLAPAKETVVITATPDPAAAAPAQSPAAAVATEQAQPGDWRQSWGKPEAPHGQSTVQAARQIEMPDTPLPPRSQYAQADVPAVPPPTPAPQPRAESKGPDPLKDPEAYSRHSETDGAAGPKKDVPEPPPSPAGAAADGSHFPIGSQSVIQAGSPAFVPVPIMTEPDYRRPPAPPQPQIPKPPEPNKMDMSNAFTQPGPANPAPMPVQAGNAFTAAPPAGPTPDSSGAFPVTQGYDRHIYGNPMGRGMPYPMPYGPMPYGPMSPPGYLPTPAAPVAQAIRPAGYVMPAPAPAPAPAVAVANRPAGPVDGLLPHPASMATPEAVAMLHDSVYPSQREWAALKLATLEWRSNPDAVLALLTAAREDPAPSVRAACIHGLAQMRVNTLPVVNTIQGLKGDADPRVQRAVEEALATLAPGAPAAAPSQPASGLVPAKSN
jgi:hypothetical protein